MSGRQLVGDQVVVADRLRYLWWAEFQKRGALHYHAIIVDPPFASEGEAHRWFTARWHAELPAGVFRAQPHTQYRSGAWFRSRAGDYVLKDVRKLGGKHYQQDYARMPRGWRTYRSHQLTRTAAEHALHETHALTVCTAAPDRPWYERQHEVWIYRVDHHVPARGGCRMFTTRSRRRSAPRAGAAALDRLGSSSIRPDRGYRPMSSLTRSARSEFTDNVKGDP